MPLQVDFSQQLLIPRMRSVAFLAQLRALLSKLFSL
jgi:hypothetical protein